jgi:hypothetical protein
MWLKVLRYAIPLGTLLAIVVAGSIARWHSAPSVDGEVAVPSFASLPPLELPARKRILEGLVVTSGERPVADALVWLRAGDEPAWGFTDASGHFRIGPLPPGPWQASIVARGYVPERQEIADQDGPRTIVIGAPLPPPPRIAPLERGDLAGRIVAPLGGELAGHAILLTPVLPLETIGGPVPRVAECDGEGRFVFDALIRGEYEVAVLPPWARGGSWPDLLRGLDAPPRRTRYDAGSGELELALESGEIEGRLLASDGEPLEGALVLLSPKGDLSRPWPPISTGADGTFVARDLPPGNYAIQVRAGAASAQVQVTLGARERRQASFEPLAITR